MLFVVDRTSIWGDEKPCEEAIQKELLKIDRRSFKSFEEYKEKIGKHFESSGFNHRICKDKDGISYIERDILTTEWTICFNNLEELMAFVRKYDDSVVIETYDEYIDEEGNRVPQIEIYDTWRE